MATTVLTRGCEFCESCLNDGWGEATEAEVEALAGAVVEEFESRVQKLTGDNSIFWQPATSEIMYECVGQTTDDHHWSEPVTTWQAEVDKEKLIEILGEVNEWAMENWETICQPTP
jgi:hypothetical protein